MTADNFEVFRGFVFAAFSNHEGCDGGVVSGEVVLASSFEVVPFLSERCEMERKAYCS